MPSDVRKPPRLTRTARVTRTARNGCIFTRNGCPAHPFRVAAQRPGAALRPFLILLRPERARSGAFSGRSSVRSGRSGRPPAGTAYRSGRSAADRGTAPARNGTRFRPDRWQDVPNRSGCDGSCSLRWWLLLSNLTLLSPSLLQLHPRGLSAAVYSCCWRRGRRAWVSSWVPPRPRRRLQPAVPLQQQRRSACSYVHTPVNIARSRIEAAPDQPVVARPRGVRPGRNMPDDACSGRRRPGAGALRPEATVLRPGAAQPARPER